MLHMHSSLSPGAFRAQIPPRQIGLLKTPRQTGKTVPDKTLIVQAAAKKHQPKLEQNKDFKQKAIDFVAQKTLQFCTVTPQVPLAASREETQVLARKLQPFMDVPIHENPLKAQKQLYLAANALISRFRSLDKGKMQPVGLALFRSKGEGQDGFLQEIEMPKAVLMHNAQHPVTHVAYAETVLRSDLPRGTPPAFGLKLLEPGWVLAANLLDPYFAKGQPEKASPRSMVNNLFKNFQPPPKDFIEFTQSEYDSVMLNAHAFMLALKAKDDLPRQSYGVQLFKMLNDIGDGFKKQAPKAKENEPATQLGIVLRDRKTNQLKFQNITTEFRNLFNS